MRALVVLVILLIVFKFFSVIINAIIRFFRWMLEPLFKELGKEIANAMQKNFGIHKKMSNALLRFFTGLAIIIIILLILLGM